MVSKKVDINYDQLKSILSYDENTGNFTWLKANSFRVKVGDVAGATFTSKKGKKYTVIGINGKIYYAHRLAYLYMTGEWPSLFIDHIDSDGLNNRWSNIRHATKSENSRNVKKKKNNTSGYCGVYFNNRIKKWIAQIGFDGKVTSLGSFSDINDAILVRKKEQERLGFHANHGTDRLNNLEPAA